MAKALLVDTTKCTGCKACQVACKQWNELPAERTEFKGSYQNPADLSASTYTIVKFKEVTNKDKLDWFFRKHQCMQCTDAACLQVCPAQAISQNELGYKERDEAKCIGCGLCVSSCPFNVPRMQENPKKAKSCVSCRDRVIAGKPTACSKACPSGALSFGERKDLLQVAYMRLAQLKKENPQVNIYGEKELGGLGVLYVLASPAKNYDLPVEPQVPKQVSFWQDLYQTKEFASCLPEKLLELIAYYSDKAGTSRKV